MLHFLLGILFYLFHLFCFFKIKLIINIIYSYGSDKRLYHIAETMVGLGHDVSFGGMFSSDLETGFIIFLY